MNLTTKTYPCSLIHEMRSRSSENCPHRHEDLARYEHTKYTVIILLIIRKKLTLLKILTFFQVVTDHEN